MFWLTILTVVNNELYVSASATQMDIDFLGLLLTSKEEKQLELCLHLFSLSYHFIYIINRLWELMYINQIFFEWKRLWKSMALLLSCSSRFHHTQLSACMHYQLVSQLNVPKCGRIHKQLFVHLFYPVIKWQTFMRQYMEGRSMQSTCCHVVKYTPVHAQSSSLGIDLWIAISVRPMGFKNWSVFILILYFSFFYETTLWTQRVICNEKNSFQNQC